MNATLIEQSSLNKVKYTVFNKQKRKKWKALKSKYK